MAKVLIDEANLRAIADAIRDKLDDPELTMTPPMMAGLIARIGEQEGDEG